MKKNINKKKIIQPIFLTFILFIFLLLFIKNQNDFKHKRRFINKMFTNRIVKYTLTIQKKKK